MSIKYKSKEDLLQIIKSLEQENASKDTQISHLTKVVSNYPDHNEMLLKDSSIPFFKFDEKFNIIDINNSFCIALNLRRNEIVGTCFLEYVDESNYGSVEDLYSLADIHSTKKLKEIGLLNNKDIKFFADLEFCISYDADSNQKIARCILTDIRETQNTPNDLEKQESLYTNTFLSLPLGVGHVEATGEIIRCNPKYAEILGTDVKSLIGKKYSSYDYSGTASQDEKEGLQRIIDRESSIFVLEKKKIKDDGSLIWLQITVTGLFNKDNSFAYYLSVIEDITERKEQKDTLLLYESIIENANFGISVINLNKEVLSSNRNFENAHQRNVEDSIGRTIDIYHTNEQMSEVNSIFNQMVEGNLNKPTLLWHMKTDGTEFPMLMSGGVVVDTSGQTFVTAYAIDITDLYNQGIELEESKTKYSTLFKHSPDCIYLADLDTLQILEANDALLELTGYTVEEITNMSLTDLIDAKNYDVQEKKRYLIQHNSITLKQRQYISKTGDKISVEINSSLIKLRDKVYISTIARDISKRLEIESELKERENFISNITDNVPVIIIVFNLKSRKSIYSNNQLYLQLGYTHSDMSEKRDEILQDIVHQDDRLDLINKISNMVDKVNAEFRLKHNQGNYLWYSSTIKRINIGGDSSNYILGFAQNIDDKKKYSEALIQSESMFRSLAESLPDTILRFDRDLKHLYVSENVSDIFDFNAHQMVNKTQEELGFTSDFVEIWTRNINKVFATGKPIESEFVLKKNGEPLLIEWRLMPEYNSTYEIKSVLVVVRTLTDLRKTERDYQRLFNEMTSGFAVHEIITDDLGKPIDYRFISVNKAFEKMTGLLNEDIKGKTVKTIMPNTEDSWIDNYGEVALTGKTIKFENYSRELDKFYMVTAYSPLKNQFATIIEDITENKKIQNQIKDQEEKYRLIVENQSDFVFKLDNNNNILYANPNFHKYLGVDEKDILSKNFIDIISNDQKECFVGILSDISKGETCVTRECMFEHANSYISWTIKTVKGEDDKVDYLIAVGHDITQIKEVQTQVETLNSELEEKVIVRTTQLQNAVTKLKEENNQHRKTKMQLEVAKDQIEKTLQQERELSQLKTRFISMVSHEYRTPLTVILSSSFIMERLIKKGELQKLEMHLEKIRAGVRQMTNLLEDVIAVGKSEEGLLDSKLQYFDIEVLVKTLIDEVNSIDSRLHTIEFDLDLHNTIIYSDPKLMRQIINNLLTNACKYSKSGTEVTITLKEDEKYFVVEVKDEGIGMSQEDLKQLFTPFFRNKGHIGSIPGSGLGLTIVKRSINLLYGKLDVKSKLHQGSTFSMFLPLSIVYPDFKKGLDQND